MFGGVVACNMTHPPQLLSTLSSLHKSSKPSDPLSLCLELKGVGTDKTGGKAAGNESCLWTLLRTNDQRSQLCKSCWSLWGLFFFVYAIFFTNKPFSLPLISFVLISRTLWTVMPFIHVVYDRCSPTKYVSQMHNKGNFWDGLVFGGVAPSCGKSTVYINFNLPLSFKYEMGHMHILLLATVLHFVCRYFRPCKVFGLLNTSDKYFINSFFLQGKAEIVQCFMKCLFILVYVFQYAVHCFSSFSCIQLHELHLPYDNLFRFAFLTRWFIKANLFCFKLVCLFLSPCCLLLFSLALFIHLFFYLFILFPLLLLFFCPWPSQPGYIRDLVSQLLAVMSYVTLSFLLHVCFLTNMVVK